MSDKLVRICNRYNTASEWRSENPILKKGEIGYDSTNNIIKVGNGSSNWNDLIQTNISKHHTYILQADENTITTSNCIKGLSIVGTGLVSPSGSVTSNDEEIIFNPSRSVVICIKSKSYNEGIYTLHHNGGTYGLTGKNGGYSYNDFNPAKKILLVPLIDGNIDDTNCPYIEFTINNLGNRSDVDYDVTKNKYYTSLTINKPEEFKSVLMDDIIINVYQIDE